jgi:hypothetical protein
MLYQQSRIHEREGLRLDRCLPTGVVGQARCLNPSSTRLGATSFKPEFHPVILNQVLNVLPRRLPV